MWTEIKAGLPPIGLKVLCRVQHFQSKNIQEHLLNRVEEDDVDWRTADDNSELSYDWTVIKWKFALPPGADAAVF